MINIACVSTIRTSARPLPSPPRAPFFLYLPQRPFLPYLTPPPIHLDLRTRTMPPSSITAQKTLRLNGSVRKRTEAPRCLCPHSSHSKKYKSLTEILQTAHRTVIDDYSDLLCEECGSGDGASEMVLCDKCDKGFHIYCLRPIVVRVPTGPWFCTNCSETKRVRSRSFFFLLILIIIIIIF